jgi:pseudaminic acid cytidylyltransferase
MSIRNAICIIPARGGSKRIKNKNIIDFNGKPLITYSINLAKKSKLFERIIVSTDSEAIAKISLECGAEVPFKRSKKLSDDFTGTTDVLKDCISRTNTKNFKYHFCIYPTAPLISERDLKEAFAKIKNKNYDCIIATGEYGSNPLRAFKAFNDKIKFKWKKFANKRTQDLEKLTYDSGTFYLYNTKKLMKLRNVMPEKTSYYKIDRFRAIDINDLEDLKFAEYLYKFNKTKNQ